MLYTKGRLIASWCTRTEHKRNWKTLPKENYTSYPRGTVLNFVGVVTGEKVGRNPCWGHSEQDHYFWLGGTDHPNGYLAPYATAGLLSAHGLQCFFSPSLISRFIRQNS